MAILKPEITGKHSETSEKRKKNNNLLKAKSILKPKYKLSGGPVFTFSWPGESVRTPAPRQLRLRQRRRV